MRSGPWRRLLFVLGAAFLFGMALLLVGCAPSPVDKAARDAFGHDLIRAKINRMEDGLLQAHVVLGKGPLEHQHVCAILLAVNAENSGETSVAATFVVPRSDGTADIEYWEWSRSSENLIRATGRSVDPRGEGLSTQYPVGIAKGVSLADLERMASGELPVNLDKFVE